MQDSTTTTAAATVARHKRQKRKQQAVAATSSTAVSPRLLPVSVPLPVPLFASQSSAVCHLFPPFCRPFTTLDQGLLGRLQWPLQRTSHIERHSIGVSTSTPQRVFPYACSSKPITVYHRSDEETGNIHKREVQTNQHNLIIRLRCTDTHIHSQELDVLVFASGQQMNHLTAVLLPSSAVQSIDSLTASSSSSLLSSSIVCSGNIRLDSSINGITATHNSTTLRDTVFTAESLPLILSHTRSTAYVHCLCVASNSCSWQQVDCLSFTNTCLLTVTPNYQVCSSIHYEIGCVDSAGTIALWSFDLQENQPIHRQVDSISRNEYDSDISDNHTQLLFARCIFCPHPRSLVLALRSQLIIVDISHILTPTNQRSKLCRGHQLSLPPLSARSVPINVNRKNPAKSTSIRDYFYQHQLTRAMHKQGTNRTVSTALSTDQKAGEIHGLCAHTDSPFYLVLLTSFYVMLIDIRNTGQPLMEWDHQAHSLPPTHLMVQTLNDNQTIERQYNQQKLRHSFITTVNSNRAEITLYHVCLSLPTFSPITWFSPVRLLSIPHLARHLSPVLSLLPGHVPQLAGVLLSVLSSSSLSESPDISPDFPSFNLIQLTNSGSLLVQMYTGNNQQASTPWLPVNQFDSLDEDVQMALCPTHRSAFTWIDTDKIKAYFRLQLSAAFYGHSLSDCSSLPVVSCMIHHQAELADFLVVPRSSMEVLEHMMMQGWIGLPAESQNELIHSPAEDRAIKTEGTITNRSILFLHPRCLSATQLSDMARQVYDTLQQRMHIFNTTFDGSQDHNLYPLYHYHLRGPQMIRHLPYSP